MPKKRATKKKKTSPAKKSGNKPAKRPAKKAASKPTPSRRAGAPAKRRSTRTPSSPPPAPAAKRSAPRRRAGKPGGSEAHLADLERLIAMMVEKEVVEVEFEEVGTRWRVRRAEPQTVAYAAAPAMAMPVGSAIAGGMAAAAPAGAPAEAEVQGEVFKSPMVGTFYRAGSPDAEPFAKAGDKVAADRTLCIIEAMKVMNEIKAEREFEVIDVLVKNGESVEFGQPLFLIR